MLCRRLPAYRTQGHGLQFGNGMSDFTDLAVAKKAKATNAMSTSFFMGVQVPFLLTYVSKLSTILDVTVPM
jgi:hypothetical protein